jgi:hypothetical protein
VRCVDEDAIGTAAELIANPTEAAVATRKGFIKRVR